MMSLFFFYLCVILQHNLLSINCQYHKKAVDFKYKCKPTASCLKRREDYKSVVFFKRFCASLTALRRFHHI